MKRILYVFFFFGFLCQNIDAQISLSGVINHYAKVTDINTTCQIKLTVDDTTGFDIGMKTILIQMKGAMIDESNSASFGDITDMGGAGWYEKNEIDSVGEDCIFLKFELQHAYDVGGKVQLVTIPNFEDAIVTDTLTANPWDGEKGGVLAFSVENELVQNANIDVSGKGFRGGTSISLPNNCNWFIQENDYFYDINDWRGAQKGEGIAEFIPSKESGKGAQATGGGGGNDHNSGGGGGANFSPGGDGGINDEPSTFGCKGNHPGVGGMFILDDDNRIFLGGGGGAGHGNNDVGTNGGNGGGIIILEAGSITGNGYRIKANGETPPEGDGDGAGGGGGGGTQIVALGLLNDLIHFEVKGGDGGLVNNNAQARCFGPGGGGSGGRLLTNQALGLWDVNFNGGAAGQTINSTSCPDSSNGAEDGSNGNYLLFYEIVESDTESTGLLSIDNQPLSQTVCEGQQAIFSLMVSGNPTNFQWQVDDGSGFQDISDGAVYSGTGTDSLIVLNPLISMSGWLFQCVISNDCDGLTSDAVILTVTQSASITNQPESIMTCEGISADFSILASGSNIQYQWQVDDGSGFQDILDGAVYSGTMTSTLTVLNPMFAMDNWLFQCIVTTGCGDLISQSVTLEVTGSASIPTQPESGTTCEGQDIDFSLFVVGSNVQYQWQVDDGSGFQDINNGVDYSGTMTSTLTVLNPTFMMNGWVFQCNITTDCGDLISDNTTLEVIELATISNQPDSAIICVGESTLFSISVGGLNIQYQWQVDEGSGFFDLSDNAIYTNTSQASLGISMANISMDGFIYQCVITYECGTIASDTALLTVTSAPTAQFDFMTNTNLVDFNNLSSFNSTNYAWDFGDNSMSTEVDPSHEYSQSGIYSVQLIAFNNCGSDTVFQEVVISLLEAPNAAFTLNNGTGCAPLLVQYTDQSSGEIDSRQWTFPGGTPNNSTDPNPLVIYNNPGIFDVTLEVTNSAGTDVISYTDFIFVDLPIFAGFNYSVDENVVTFTNTSQNATSFQWNFGDNSSGSVEENPVHEFSAPGVYNVTLVASNPLCGSAITVAVDVLFTSDRIIGDEDFIKVFPNPVNDFLTIDFSENSNSKSLKIYNSKGQVVFQKNQLNDQITEIDFSDFPSGIYIFEVIIEGNVFVDKIVKY